MRYKATFVMGLGTGYVLGSRAGRNRYEQISRLASSVWQKPMVQGATGTVTQQAGSLLGAAKSRVSNRIGGQEVNVENGYTSPTTIRV
ncbi:MAG TPA: hypothetical protein VEZ46_15740 [Mycobacteriales bacterium]|jgi:hypothetical protein|nr:hypothetical protein [Mycobacteriales bacterium]